MTLGQPEIRIVGLNGIATVPALFGANRKRSSKSYPSRKREMDHAEKPAPRSSASRSRAGKSNSSNSRGAKYEVTGGDRGRSSAGGSGCRNENGRRLMNPKVTPDHLGRAAVVYVRQSTMPKVTSNLESQRRQYDLAKAAEVSGFASLTVIDDDLGRSGSSRRFVPAILARCTASKHHVGTKRAGLASSHRLVRACRYAGLSIQMAPTIANRQRPLAARAEGNDVRI
jgi:hypothetical protein